MEEKSRAVAEQGNPAYAKTGAVAPLHYVKVRLDRIFEENLKPIFQGTETGTRLTV